MPCGYSGKILRVNLSSRTVEVEQPTPEFYRKYWGGSCMGTYFLLREVPPHTDALSPENKLMIMPSVVTGAPISGVTRVTLTAKSPLTGTAGDTQAGGRWPAELKRAGFDGIIVEGRASEPVYIWIEDGAVEIRDAGHIWGKVTGETEEIIRQELGDRRVEVLGIGPAGEHLVLFAAVMSGLGNACGRNGLGAVFGSKNLKAIAVRGRRAIEIADAERLRELGAEGAREARDFIFLYDLGTAGTVTPLNEAGGFPTRNYSQGVFAGADSISGVKLRDTYLISRAACWGCAVRCKRVVEVRTPYEVDPRYGGPEYETVAMLGSDLMIDDLAAVAKGHEMCNRYGLDTISAGATIAFAIECFENGLIGLEDTDGLELKWGDGDVMLALIDLIAHREGFGDILADGSARAAQHIGNGADRYAIHVKRQELPAHMVQHKPTYSMIFAVNSFGADHESACHDAFYSPGIPEEGKRRLAALGIYNTKPMEVLDADKVRWLVYTQLFCSVCDSLNLCVFVYGPTFQLYPQTDIVRLVEAVVGWKTSLWELMKVGERRINLQRCYNAREGFNRTHDRLPDRVHDEPIPDGPLAGQCVDRDAWTKSVDLYYRMMNWNPETGNPTEAKLVELGLEWAVDELLKADVSLE